MKADDIWAFYIDTADRFLQSAETENGDAFAAILAEADDLRNVGDCLGRLVGNWESIHKPVKIPQNWTKVPTDISNTVSEYNHRISEIEEALQDESLKLDSLDKAFGSPAWRKGILQKITKLENKISKIAELLLNLIRDVPNEVGRFKIAAASDSTEAMAVVASVETGLVEITQSFLKAVKADELSLERLHLLLSNALQASVAANRNAEQKLLESKRSEEQKGETRDDKKPKKKASSKVTIKPRSVRSLGKPALANREQHQFPLGTPIEGWSVVLNEGEGAVDVDLGKLTDLVEKGALNKYSFIRHPENSEEIRLMGEVAAFEGLLENQPVAIPTLDSIVHKLYPVIEFKYYLKWPTSWFPSHEKFEQKLKGASKYISKALNISGRLIQHNDKEVFFIWDTTFFGSAEKGMAISKTGIFWFCATGQKGPLFYPFAFITEICYEDNFIVFKFLNKEGHETVHKWHVIVAAANDDKFPRFAEGLADLAKHHNSVLNELRNR